MSKKIAFIYLGRKGGGAAYCYEMAKGLINNGAELYLFISKDVDNLSKWMDLNYKQIETVKTYSNKFNFVINTIKFRLFKIRKIRKKYSNLSVDACYIPYGFEHTWDSYFVNSIKHKQLIETSHDPIAHSTNSLDGVFLRLAKKILNFGVKEEKPNDIILLSSCFTEYVKEKYNIDYNHIHVIPHGIFDFYETLPNNGAYEYDKTKTNYLFFGRIDRYKGLDILAYAFKKVIDANPNSTLTIVGSGDFSPYKSLYRDVPNVVVINRWIQDDEVGSFFDKKSRIIAVLPYLDATQSGVVSLAMSSKIPLIVSDAGGLVEQVKDGVTGFVFKSKDADELAKTMLFVASRDNSDIINNASLFIKSLSWDSLSKKVLEIVDSHLIKYSK